MRHLPAGPTIVLEDFPPRAWADIEIPTSPEGVNKRDFYVKWLTDHLFNSAATLAPRQPDRLLLRAAAPKVPARHGAPALSHVWIPARRSRRDPLLHFRRHPPCDVADGGVRCRTSLGHRGRGQPGSAVHPEGARRFHHPVQPEQNPCRHDADASPLQAHPADWVPDKDAENIKLGSGKTLTSYKAPLSSKTTPTSRNASSSWTATTKLLAANFRMSPL